MPPKESTITKLAKVVSKFHSTTFPSKFGSGPEIKILETLASYANFPFNYVSTIFKNSSNQLSIK